MRNRWSRIEVVITGLTRNQVVLSGLVGSNPTDSVKKGADIRSFFYGVGGIRTHEPRKDYLISSQARYDHFDTTPSVPHAASRCACLDIIGYQTAGMQEQNSSYADSEIWYNQLYTQRPVRGMGMQYGGAGTADQNQGYNKG